MTEYVLYYTDASTFDQSVPEDSILAEIDLCQLSLFKRHTDLGRERPVFSVSHVPTWHSRRVDEHHNSDRQVFSDDATQYVANAYTCEEYVDEQAWAALDAKERVVILSLFEYDELCEPQQAFVRHCIEVSDTDGSQ